MLSRFFTSDIDKLIGAAANSFNPAPALVIADFLIFDPIFPRSVRRCLLYCQEAIHKISGRKKNEAGNDVERRLENLVDWLRLATIDDFVKAGLHESLTQVINTTIEIGDDGEIVTLDELLDESEPEKKKR